MLLPISSGSVHCTLISGNSCATQKRGVAFTSSVVLKQRNAKDAKTSVVECYTGGVNCAGATIPLAPYPEADLCDSALSLTSALNIF